MIITNNHNVSLITALWLLYDDYDYIDKPNYISATTLLKPIREIILNNRIPNEERSIDLLDMASRAFGRSVHGSIEQAWSNCEFRAIALKKLGYSDKVIENIVINPTSEQVNTNKNIIPIYMEQRHYKEIDGFTIGGKYDLVAEGIPHDHKTTSTYTWTKNTNEDQYRLQGSIYRWLVPEIITRDFIRIEFYFTDWKAHEARRNPDYPPKRLQNKDIPLLSLEETENWIKSRLELIKKYWNSPEKDIPECTKEEMWLDDPVYKYYSDPTKTDGRATKNFNDPIEANAHLISKGKGTVIPIYGEPKKCGYCSAFSECAQKDKYFTQLEE